MQKPPIRRGVIVKSMIRMESWSRDRIAADVMRAQQMYSNCAKEHALVSEKLNAAQEAIRASYRQGVSLELDQVERMRCYLLNLETERQESTQREQQSKKLLEELKLSLEKQALHIRGLERVKTRHHKSLTEDLARRDERCMDDLILARREQKHV